MVLALVEKRAGLLSVPQVHPQAHPTLADIDELRDLAMRDDDFLLQAFKAAHLRIVANKNAARLTFGDEQIDEERPPAIRALRQRLQNEVCTGVVRVAIDDDSRQPVGFGAHAAAGCGVNGQSVAIGEGRPQPFADEPRPRPAGLATDP